MTLPLLAVIAAWAPASLSAGSAPTLDIHPQWASNDLKISFERVSASHLGSVISVPASGKRVEALLLRTANLGSYSVSPDWSAIAWITGVEPRQFVHVANVRTRGREIFKTGEQYAPSWAPDSSRFVFSSYDGQIMTATRSGDGVRPVAPSGAHPDWSPKGNLIAYENNGFIRVVRPDGRGNSRLTSGRYPAWSPDGTTLAAWGNADDPRNVLRVASLHGEVRTYVLQAGAVEGALTWSPTARTIVYASKNGRGYASLVSLDLANGRERTISPFGGFGGFSYSHDGTRIAMSDFGGCRGRAGIYVMRPDGSSRIRITQRCHP